MPLTVEDIAALLRLIEASGLDEVELEHDGTRLMTRRGGASPPALPAVGARLASAASQPSPRRNAAAPVASIAAATPIAPLPRPAARPLPARPAAPGLVSVNAPMVGSFFRRPAPDQPVFVEVGGRVRKGQPLCLIEVMKLYTTIEAPTDGVVEQILAEDGQLVEYDQPLVAIRAAAQAAS